MLSKQTIQLLSRFPYRNDTLIWKILTDTERSIIDIARYGSPTDKEIDELYKIARKLGII